MLDLRERSDGVSIAVRVTPKARQASIGGIHDGALKIAVTEPADKGKANEGVVRAVCELLKVAPAQISILAGQTARRKTLLVTGVPAAEIKAAVANRDR